MKFSIGDGISLRSYLANLDSDDLSQWMIFDEESYSLDMLVYPVHLESSDIWDVYEELEHAFLTQDKGYGNLLSKEQLKDILDNLKRQKKNYSELELENAINYYSINDTFYEVKNT